MVSPTPISPGYRTFVAVTCVFTFLSGITVILRYFSRRLGTKWKADDWAILGAYINAIGYLIINVLVATLGMAGYPITEVDLPHLVVYEKLLLANNIIYNTSIVLSKVSILLMYRRIFQTKSFGYWTWPLFFLLVAYWLIVLLVELFGYSPINGQWNPTIPSKHINELTFGLAMSAWNMAMDIIILAMPQVIVWRLQMSQRKRVLVSLVFLLGALVCVASIVRLYYFTQISYADPTSTLTKAGIWTVVETNVAIICACLPTLMPFFYYCFGSREGNKQTDARGKLISSYVRRKVAIPQIWWPSRGQSRSRLRETDDSIASTLHPKASNEQPIIMHSISEENDRKAADASEQQDGVWVQRHFAISDAQARDEETGVSR